MSYGHITLSNLGPDGAHMSNVPRATTVQTQQTLGHFPVNPSANLNVLPRTGSLNTELTQCSQGTYAGHDGPVRNMHYVGNGIVHHSNMLAAFGGHGHLFEQFGQPPAPKPGQ